MLMMVAATVVAKMTLCHQFVKRADEGAIRCLKLSNALLSLVFL